MWNVSVLGHGDGGDLHWSGGWRYLLFFILSGRGRLGGGTALLHFLLLFFLFLLQQFDVLLSETNLKKYDLSLQKLTLEINWQCPSLHRMKSVVPCNDKTVVDVDNCLFEVAK